MAETTAVGPATTKKWLVGEFIYEWYSETTARGFYRCGYKLKYIPPSDDDEVNDG